MNTDNYIESLVIKYLSGHCTEEEKEALLSWIKESEDNRINSKPSETSGKD
jgi:hypothetical protein